jgi:DNA ligase 1
MNKVCEIFNTLQQTASTKQKIDIIKQNSDNELFKKCLVFLLDDNITTGIALKKFTKIVTKGTQIIDNIDNTFCEVLDYVKEHNTGKDDDIVQTKILYDCLYNNSQIDLAEFYKGIVTKSIKIGCDKKIVNKAIPKLIPIWSVQQAYPISDKNKPKNNEWFCLSEKINGCNCSYYKGKMFSRQGKEMKGFNHIIQDIEKLGLTNMYINGELVYKNIEDLSNSDSFQKSVSIINNDTEDKQMIELIVYEILTNEEFEQGVSNLTFKERLNNLLAIKEKIVNLKLQSLKIVTYFYNGVDISQIERWLKYADTHDMEGCILNKDALWQNKRNNSILKIKSFKSSDILCTGIKEGSGKYENMLGNIICNYKGFELGVGSGFTDEQRNYYWNNPNEIVGKIVQIKYKEETKNKDGGISVQFPIFITVRNDKQEESYE